MINESIHPYNELFGYPEIAAAFDLGSASSLAALQVEIGRQATTIAYNDAYMVVAGVMIALIPLIALFGRMTGEGFLHKEFLGDHIDLPVRFCATAEAVVPTLQAAISGVPRPELEETRGVRAM